MDELILLFENIWLTKADDKESYFRVRRAQKSIQKFISEQLGWRLVINEKLVRLEKNPSCANPSMGIEFFKETLDYSFFCALLIFLDDLADAEQFLLSSLLDTTEALMSTVSPIDFTSFTTRKSMVRALQYAEEVHLIKVSDGSVKRLEQGQNTEVLYENTGVSQYFTIHLGKNINDYKSYLDFENHDDDILNQDRKALRTHRVYRRLILSPALYWNSLDDPDSLYLKNQRQWISKNLSDALHAQLEIHNGSAFLMFSEDETFGEIFPSQTMLSGFILFLCGELRANIGDIHPYPPDIVTFSASEWGKTIIACREKYLVGLSQEYKKHSDSSLINIISDGMVRWSMLSISPDKTEYKVLPAAFKLSGKYPKKSDEKESS